MVLEARHNPRLGPFKVLLYRPEDHPAASKLHALRPSRLAMPVVLVAAAPLAS